MMSLAEAIAERERRFDRNEQAVRRIVKSWLREQNAEVLASLADDDILSPELVLAGYDFNAATEDLKSVLREPFYVAAEEEAAFVFDQNANTFKKGITPEIDRMLESAVAAVLSEEYWHSVVKGVQTWTQNWLSRALKAPKEVLGISIDPQAITSVEASAIVTEETKRQLPSLVEDLADDRSVAIAETEVSGIMNAGGNGAGEALSAIGAIDLKTWLTMRDEKVRRSHWKLHMVSIPHNQNFNVGGHPAPHPGWWKLPIGERIHCRCWTYHGPIDQSEMNAIIDAMDEDLKEVI